MGRYLLTRKVGFVSGFVFALLVSQNHAWAQPAPHGLKKAEATASEYPLLMRYGLGLGATVFGGLALYRGHRALGEVGMNGLDQAASLGLVAFGAYRFIDGVRTLATPLVNRFESAAVLRQHAETARQRRLIRSGALMLMGVSYLHLFQTGREEFEWYVISGSGLLCAGLFRLFFLSPVERAWKEYQAERGGLSWSWDVAPQRDGLAANLVLRF